MRIYLRQGETLTEPNDGKVYPSIIVYVSPEDIKNGKKKTNSQCPIALATRKMWGEKFIAHVSKHYFSVARITKRGQKAFSSYVFYAKPTEKMKKFIHDFDRDKKVKATLFEIRNEL